jgi:hypothetical protein
MVVMVCDRHMKYDVSMKELESSTVEFSNSARNSDFEAPPRPIAPDA